MAHTGVAAAAAAAVAAAYVTSSDNDDKWHSSASAAGDEIIAIQAGYINRSVINVRHQSLNDIRSTLEQL